MKGHNIGNQMMNNKIALFLTENEFVNEIKENEKLVNNFGEMTKIFRHGCFFNKKMIQIIEKLGYYLVLGNINTFDTFIKCNLLIKFHILFKLKSGSIIILHDIQSNIELLDSVIPKILSNGYNFDKISNLVKIKKIF
ncbi:Hypothetical protein KVN_LOCUS542 [uncultured virus]|nr:Hypothetical protein KVN_LOCUS542 [uncultured virus]